MRRIIAAVVFSLAVLAAAPVEAKLERVDLWSWKSRADICGRGYQRFVASNLEFLVPGFLESMLESARWDGANADQIAVIVDSFEDGRRKALKKGWTKAEWGKEGQSLIDIFIDHLEYYEELCKLAKNMECIERFD